MSTGSPAAGRTQPDAGVVFPLVKGERSTSATGRHLVAESLRRVDTTAHERARDAEHWHKSYVTHYKELTRLSALQHGQLIANDGLGAAQAAFRFRRRGAETTLAEALTFPRPAVLGSERVRGEGRRGLPLLSLPYQGRRLVGSELSDQMHRWVEAGVVEPSCADAVDAVIAHPEWLDLSDTTVAVLGVGSEMGPYVSLMGWGGHVVGVDLPSAELWQRTFDVARRSTGTLTFPVHGDVGRPGADLVTQLPELAEWLATGPRPDLVGQYLYADGADHVRVTVAGDAIAAHLMARRPGLGLGYLATPTDVYAVPATVVDDANRRFDTAGAGAAVLRAVSAQRLLRRNYPTTESTLEGTRFGLCDALVPQQGANYALAKRIQQWRALQAKASRRLVSINVAPATRTRSVVRNGVLRSAYNGAHRFGLEIFAPSTASTLMAALLVNDLRNPESAAQPGRPLEVPFHLFAEAAAHGGMWRAPYAPRSALSLAVALGMARRS